MRVLSIPCLIMASINLYVGAYYLFFYMKRPQIRKHLPFALLCLSVCLYDILCSGLYNSTSIEQGVFWERLQFFSIDAIAIFSLWFTGIYTEQDGNKTIRFFISLFIIIPVFSFFAGPELTLSTAHPALKNINFLNSLKITYHEAAVGIVYQFEMVSAIIAYIYMFCLYFGHYRKTGDKALLPVISCQIIYFLGVINDSLVAMQYYSFFYISEYAFFFIVIAMAYILLDNFVDMHAAFEELNTDLERKVYEKTREILDAQEQVKRLEGIIPICMYCKKIRDDKESWLQMEQYISEHSEALFSHGVCPDCIEKLT
jgi:hypothetical protein